MVTFWISFSVLLFAIIILDKKYCMLRDISSAPGHQPYSWSRVQLAWWTVIVLSGFIAILFQYWQAPTLDNSTLILLGISAATTATARVIDISDEQNNLTRIQDDFGKNFFLDILSDNGGVSISRFQTVVFNFVFGVWFIASIVRGLRDVIDLNKILPPIDTNNLILLGLSTATYVAMKTTENKSTTATLNIDEEAVG